MAAPVLLGSTAIINTGTTINIPANAASPAINDYRVMVLHTSDRASNGQPVSASTPSGWTWSYQSPRGRSTIRVWVWIQKWTNSTPAGTISLSGNFYYAVTIGRVSGYTLINPTVTFGPIVSGPTVEFGSGSTLIGPAINTEADSLRMDFWTGFYATGANSGTTTIDVPAGQTGSTVFRGSNAMGYVTRIGSESILTKGITGTRTATFSPAASVSAVGTLAIGGWKELTKATSSAMALTKNEVVGTKKVTRSTTTTMGLTASSELSGRAATVESSTVLALDSTAQRVHLTSTTLDLTSSCVGGHDSVGNSVDVVGLVNIVDGTHIAEPVQTTTEMAVKSEAVGRVTGGGAPGSIVDEYTHQYQPPLRPLRFMFQSIRDKRWLNWDVPLVDPEITFTLSGPTIIRGKIGPEDIEVIRGLEAWGTWLHVEESGIIRASAILQPLATQGDDLSIEAAGVHAYAIGTQFESEFSAIQIDAAEAMRQLWGYLQLYGDAKLGVTLDPTNTGRLLGKPAVVEIARDAQGEIIYKELRLDEQYGGLYRVDEGTISDEAWQKLLFWGYPVYIDTTTGKLVLLVTPADFSVAVTGYQAYQDVTENADGSVTVKWMMPDYKFTAAEPYELAWWNDIDCGREIENLTKQTPFDWAETPRWAADGLNVQQHIAIGYPRLGTKRFDLRFAEDENLLAAVVLRETPSFYASQVIVRGAGEGRNSIRAQAGGNNPYRLRRVASLTDKTITTRERALELAAVELYRRLAAYTISEITIDATHDNAPMGSFTLGDDILVQANLPYYGEVQLWHRILAYSWYPDRNEVKLTLRRSEQFNYGRVLPN